LPQRDEDAFLFGRGKTFDALHPNLGEHLGVRAAEALRVASLQFFVVSHCCSILWGGG
jgi:hypothetical protein